MNVRFEAVHDNDATIGGLPLSANIGNADAGTQRVVLASDQPSLNVIASQAISFDSGVTDAQTQRVIIATDQPTLNVDILNHPVSFDNGGFDTQTQRVVIANDQPIISVATDNPTGVNVIADSLSVAIASNQEVGVSIGDIAYKAQKVMAQSFPVVIASDQIEIAVKDKAFDECIVASSGVLPSSVIMIGGDKVGFAGRLSLNSDGYCNSNIEKVGDIAINVNGGNKDAGTLTVTLADDDSQAAALVANQVLELAKLDDVKSNQVELLEKFDNVGLFGDFHVSEITPTYQSHFVNMVPDREWHKNTVGAATVAHKDESGFYFMELKGSTAGDPAADDCLAYTRKTFHYRNGQVGIMRCVVACPDGVGANNDMHAGHFWGLGHPYDDETSVLSEQFMGFHYSSDGFIIAHRVKNFGFREHVGSGSWNGTPLTMTLDPTKLNLYEIRFYWLGVGGIEFRIFDSVENKFITVHTISYTNTGLECITSTPLLAPTFGIKMPTTVIDRTVALRMLVSSVGCFIGGKNNVSFPLRSIFHGETGVGDGTTVLNIRNMDVVNGIKNWANVAIQQISISATNGAANLTTLSLYKNGTIAGATWVDLETNESVMETDIVSAGGGSDGTLLYAIPLANDDSKIVDLTGCGLTLYQNESISFVINTTGSTSDVQISILIQEDI